MSEKEELKLIIGKTISNAHIEKINEYNDDIPYLIIEFTDGTKIIIEAEYNENYTGNSVGEYAKIICFRIEK